MENDVFINMNCDKPAELLKQLYEEHGDALFNQTEMLYGYVADLLPDTNEIKPKLLYAIKTCIYKYITNEPPERMSNLRNVQISNMIVQNTGIALDVAKIIVYLFAYATGRTEKIKKYYNSLHPVKVNGKYGYADSSQNIVISPKYDKAKPFIGDRAKVCVNGSFGFIDRSGEEVIPLTFEYADDFHRDTTEVMLNGAKLVIDKNGNIISQ